MVQILVQITCYHPDQLIRTNKIPDDHIKCHCFSDRLVLLGNHRDAWVFGGIDPSSGTACMMEIAKALGQKYKQGNIN